VAPAQGATDHSAGKSFDTALRRKVVRDTARPERFPLEERMAYYGVRAVSVAVVDKCRLADVRAYGTANADGAASTPQTLFQAGSVSKVVAAVGAMKLVEEGKLSLDSDIAQTLTQWTLPRPSPTFGPVTLRRLLSHSSGLGVEGFKGYAVDAPLPSLTQVLDGASPANTAAVRLERAPGTAWQYSGGGYVVTQMLIEQASGRNFAEYMRSRVLKPAGMGSSTYSQPLPEAVRSQAAVGTLADGSPIPGGWRVYPEQAAAGLWTTPTDLARFGIALMEAARSSGPSLLTGHSMSEMMRPQAGSWGLGLEVVAPGSPRKLSHTGAPVGYRTLWVMFPDTCQGAAIMTNADEGMTLAYEVARALADRYHWPDPMPSEGLAFTQPNSDLAHGIIGTYQLVEFPAERFSVGRTANGSLYWQRFGRGRRQLEAASHSELVSPDSGTRLRPLGLDKSTGAVSSIEVRFGGGANVARRVDDRH